MKSTGKKTNKKYVNEEEKMKKARRKNALRKIIPFSLSLLAAFLLVYVSILTAESSDFTGSSETAGVQYADSAAENSLDVSDVPVPAGDDKIDPEKSGLPEKGKENSFNYSELPKYGKNAYTTVNDNFPFFTREDFTDVSSETYGELDSLGRCTACFAVVGPDLMPTDERGSIGSVKPTGWQNVKYDIVDGGYLYNRCHLIGYQLTAENANKQNLITGTRYLNIDGMLEFENMTADYIKETGNHVLYRVTPIFRNKELVARGVLMEGYSVEDNGEGICFCIYAYNVQPGIKIDYKTGESSLKK